MYKEDTIAAIATAPGAGGIGIIRISGQKAMAIADTVFASPTGKKIASLPTYTAAFGRIVDKKGELIDEAIALLMRGPKSYTCEDVVELQCHGGPQALRSVLRAVYEAGARPAEPGEFTKRAFLNGRLDLSRAQAVMDVINAKTDLALRQATGHLTGSFSGEIHGWRQEILSLIAHLEALIDFPEEGVEEAETAKIRQQIEAAAEQIAHEAQVESLTDTMNHTQFLLTGESELLNIPETESAYMDETETEWVEETETEPEIWPVEMGEPLWSASASGDTAGDTPAQEPQTEAATEGSAESEENAQTAETETSLPAQKRGMLTVPDLQSVNIARIRLSKIRLKIRYRFFRVEVYSRQM